MNKSANGKPECAYSRPVPAGVMILGFLLSGCAGTSSGTLSEVLDEVAPVDEIALTEPIDKRNGENLARRTVGIAQAGILYTRSFHVDPINRPVSNLLSLSSFALKSAGGLVRRVGLGTVAFPSLESQPIPELSYAQGMDLDKWEQDLDRISGQKREKGTIEFLVDGNEYFPRLIASFESARESIDIRTYIFDNDDYAIEVADILKRRSADVNIRVMIDALGNLLAMQADAESAPQDHAPPMSMEAYLEKGSEIAVRSRANPWLTGDHTKTTIIDRKIAFVGGMNIGREYRYEWHDLMMQVTGPIVDRLQHDSDKAWARAGILGDLANLFRFLAGKKHGAGDDGYEIRPLYTRSFDSQIYRAQVEAIRRSSNYILIENAYFSDDAILYELARARRRGRRAGHTAYRRKPWATEFQQPGRDQQDAGKRHPCLHVSRDESREGRHIRWLGMCRLGQLRQTQPGSQQGTESRNIRAGRRQ
jgi:hypothetical protein